MQTESDKCVSGALDDTIQGVPDNTHVVVPKGELQYLYTRFFYKKNFYTKMGLKNLQNLNKMLRKSLALNPWAGIFKNADFC